MNSPHQFDFPSDKRDIIDQRLRAFVDADNVQSIRPERQQAAAKQIVKPVLDDPQLSDIGASPVGMRQTKQVVQGPATPMQDPESISIDLPSRFHYYDFKDLYVKPFRVFHLAKLAKANETGSLQTMAEAVSSVLSSSTTNRKNLAFDLTMADFNAVLYWLRLNSFGKKQMRVQSMCMNPDHIKKVADKVLPEKSLQVHTLYTESDIKTTYLDSVPDPDRYHVVYKDQRIDLRPETMRDVVEFMDHPKWEDEEFQYLARIGVVLDIPGKSVGQRAEIAGLLDPDQALIALEFAEMLDNYGIQETVTTKCMECGASGTVKIVVDAPTFLSPEF